MTSKKSSRGGLLALACGLLLAAFISFVFVNASLAQAPTPAPAAPAAAAAAEAAPPACDGTAKPPVLEKCTPNSGDTAWMLTSMALVLMMTVPGLGLFYGGMVRKKNVGDTVMTSFAITCLVTVLWVIVNYSTAFRAGTPFLGGFDRAFLQGILSDISKNIGNPNPLAPTIPETVYMCFQMTFAIITPALIAGAFAERMKFSAMLWFIGLWATLVYAPIAHWVWGPDGFLNSANSDAWVHVLDFAGGTVVHVNSGTAGLMACLVLGKRKDTGPGHNMVLTFIGASLLWVGWFGFNAGSATAANMQAGMAMTVTQVATATAALTWMFVEWALRGKPTVIGICTRRARRLRRACGRRSGRGTADRRVRHRAVRRHRRPDRRQRGPGHQPDRRHPDRLHLRRGGVLHHPQGARPRHGAARTRRDRARGARPHAPRRGGAVGHTQCDRGGSRHRPFRREAPAHPGASLCFAHCHPEIAPGLPGRPRLVF